MSRTRVSDYLKPGTVGVMYGRHSTNKQEAKMQRNVVINVLNRYQCSVSRWLIDEGVSATKTPMDKRRNLQRLFRIMEKERPAFIITYARDRLARDPVEHQKIRQKALELGIPIILANHETIYDTGDLVSQLVQDGFTAFEVEQTRVRTRDTVRALTKKGKWFGGRVPFGYHLESKRLLLVPELADIVRQVFDLYEQGWGLQTTAQKVGHGLTRDRIRTILSNPIYAGYVVVRGGKQRKFWELAKTNVIDCPIVSLNQWERCHALLEQKREHDISPQPYVTPFLLRGILFCSKCNQPMQAKNQQTKYVTRRREEKYYGRNVYRCPSHGKVTSEELDDVVWGYVLKQIPLSSLAEIEDKLKGRIETEKVRLQHVIAEVKKKQQETEFEMIRARTRAKDTSEVDLRFAIQQYRRQLEKKLDELKTQRKSAERELALLQKNGSNLVVTPQLIEEATRDIAARRRLLLTVVSRVTVLPGSFAEANIEIKKSWEE